MDKELFKTRYKKYDVCTKTLDRYIKTITSFEEYIHKDIKDSTIDDIRHYFKYLIVENKNTYNNVIHFTRYYFYIDKKVEYIHMTKYFNTVGVLENILDRIILYESVETKADLMESITLPEFGVDVKELPKYTKEFMDKLNKHLPKVTCNKILAGNNHRISAESFDKEKEFYQKAESLEQYLKEKHERKVNELRYYFDNSLVWFEQIISKEAIEFVRNNQEILSGVVKEDKLYVTKIPYEITNYLQEEDSKLKRYYACHCSFVRENILSDTENIPKEWCNCSAGFAKYPYEQIFDQELDVTLLKTPLDGDYICRFVIDLKDIEYKKL